MYDLSSGTQANRLRHGSSQKKESTEGNIQAILAKGRVGAAGTKVDTSPTGLECLSELVVVHRYSTTLQSPSICCVFLLCACCEQALSHKLSQYWYGVQRKTLASRYTCKPPNGNHHVIMKNSHFYHVTLRMPTFPPMSFP